MLTTAQEALFEEVANAGELIFAAGPKGITANIVGEFYVKAHEDEVRLQVGDGKQHVHVDWSRVSRVEVGQHHGEGMLTFFDADERLFRLYRPAGPFGARVQELAGDLS